MTILDRFLISIGYKVEREGMKAVEGDISHVKDLAVGMGAAIVGALAGIKHIVHSSMERMGAIQNFSEQMGIAQREVDALNRVAIENESSAEAMMGGLRTLTSMAGMAAMGIGRGAKVFEKFGIKVKDSNGKVKTTEELLGDVADKLQSLDSIGARKALGSRLGFDAQTVLLLSKGRENFMRLRQAALDANPFAEKDYEAAEGAEKAYIRAGIATQQLKDRLAVGLFPTMMRITERFSAWTRDSNNIRKIQTAINQVLSVVEFLWRHAGKLLAVFALFKIHKYGHMFEEWGRKLAVAVSSMHKGAAGAGLLAKGLIAVRSVLVGGLLGLILLLAEDLWVFYNGGDSLTGWMLKRFPQAVDVMAGAIEVLGGLFMALATGSGPIGLTVFAIMALVRAAYLIKDAWNPITQWWEELWDKMSDTVANWYNSQPRWLRILINRGSMGTIGTWTGAKQATNESINASGRKIAAWAGNQPKGLANEDWKRWNGEDEGEPSWLHKATKQTLTVPAMLAAPAGGVPTWGPGIAGGDNFNFGDIYFKSDGQLADPATARKHARMVIDEIRKMKRNQTRNQQPGAR